MADINSVKHFWWSGGGNEKDTVFNYAANSQTLEDGMFVSIGGGKVTELVDGAQDIWGMVGSARESGGAAGIADFLNILPASGNMRFSGFPEDDGTPLAIANIGAEFEFGVDAAGRHRIDTGASVNDSFRVVSLQANAGDTLEDFLIVIVINGAY